MMRRSTVSLFSVFFVISFCFGTYSYGELFYVAQESAAGTGDFDSNILGQIEAFSTTLTADDFYDWWDDGGTPPNTTGGSYNGDNYGGPDPISSMTQLFLVDASDGMSLFVVHDNRFDGSGGDATMRFDLSGSTSPAGYLAYDDPTSGPSGADPRDAYLTYGFGTEFHTRNIWGSNYTDGFAIGGMEGYWTMLGQLTDGSKFDEEGTPGVSWGDPTGITGWQIVSADSSAISLGFDVGRRVRIQAVPVPGAVLLGVLGLSVAGMKLRKGT